MRFKKKYSFEGLKKLCSGGLIKSIVSKVSKNFVQDCLKTTQFEKVQEKAYFGTRFSSKI